MQEKQQAPRDPFKDAVLAGQWAMGINQSTAIPWMLLTNKPGTFGRRYLFVNAAIGMLVIYPCMPLLVPLENPQQAALYGKGWYALMSMLVIHRLASAIAGGRRHLFDVGHAWMGFWKELGLLGLVVWVMSYACPALGVLMGVSYLAKQFLLLSIDWRYARIRGEIDSQRWEAEEVQRVLKG